eukprot:TRINITY_DN10640_c0_g1_i1.p1 TRINITY_DN10640_c0_g1~~TRINITY_DN10640_c0_g1_i1.p1  ORF type:complete len:172 (+),score=37.33 TRINITY_DN10640_c0_g1_i1:62-577(+)
MCIRDRYQRRVHGEVLKKYSTPEYTLHELKPEDYDKGFFELLGQLTAGNKLAKEEFLQILNETHQNPGHVIIVAEDTKSGKVIAAGTAFVERKMIRGGSTACHIEDVVVDRRLRGKGLGKVILEALLEIASQYKCYKSLVDCKDHNVSFYQKFGFQKKGVQMAVYVAKPRL